MGLVAGAGVLAACGQGRDAPRSVLGPPRAAGPAEAPQVGLEVGQHAPPFTVVTVDGQRLSSADITGKGKPFILYFFATW